MIIKVFMISYHIFYFHLDFQIKQLFSVLFTCILLNVLCFNLSLSLPHLCMPCLCFFSLFSSSFLSSLIFFSEEPVPQTSVLSERGNNTDYLTSSYHKPTNPALSVYQSNYQNKGTELLLMRKKNGISSPYRQLKGIYLSLILTLLFRP